MKTAFLAGVVIGASALAHDGRRFDIQVVNNGLVAQGYLRNTPDDGAGVVRPYVNAMHGHWSNLTISDAATASLPGFDIIDPGPLVGHDVSLELTGASKWVAPPITPDPALIPTLESLSVTDQILVSLGGSTVSTTQPGSLKLATLVDAGGEIDIDPTYAIGMRPSNVIYVLDFTLSTDAPGIGDAEVHVILSPDGMDPVTRLHHASLHLERYLGDPVPAPGAVGVLIGAGLFVARRRR